MMGKRAFRLGRAGWLVCAVLAGCGDDGGSPPADGGVEDAGADAICRGDADCDDGVFCNGLERCVPGTTIADARGCVPADMPACAGLRVCDEEADRCVVDCASEPDADGDGALHPDCAPEGAEPDCDDDDPKRSPRFDEVCDPEGRDEDCDPTTYVGRDDDDPNADKDADGFYDVACFNVADDGTRFPPENTGDCNDAISSIRPMALEVCNGIDDDCDGEIDDGVTVEGYRDRDRDGYGDVDAPMMACRGAAGFVAADSGLTEPTECDMSPVRNPGLLEACDGIDNDCDGEVDDGTTEVPWYRDADGDLWGDARAGIVVSCGAVPGHALVAGDCDDADPLVHPAAPERCNGRDDDCDGRAGFVVAPGDTEDDDGDGVADGRCTGGTDCDDRNPRVFQGATEVCDERDNDCNGEIDDGTGDVSWFQDRDGDGYGDALHGGTSSCEPIRGFVLVRGDCDDLDRDVRPGAADGCLGRSGVDDDCDGEVDEDTRLSAAFPDADGDGVGAGAPIPACVPPEGFASRGGDCAPDDPDVSPLAAEVCDPLDGVDDDCDGLIDCEDPGCEPDPACEIDYRLVLVAGGGQSGFPGQALPTPIAVRVVGIDTGDAVSGQVVRLTSSNGGGAATPELTSGADGIVRFPVFLGIEPGAERFWVATPGAAVLRVLATVEAPAPGDVTTLVNSSARSFSWTFVSGPAAFAEITRACDVLVDGDDVYFSSQATDSVYRLRDGVVTRIAGTGVAGYSGDFGPATSAHLAEPCALAKSGEALYVAARTSTSSFSAGVVREIRLDSGVIDTVAGGGSSLASTGYGPSLTLSAIQDLAVGAGDALLLVFPSGPPAEVDLVDLQLEPVDTSDLGLSFSFDAAIWSDAAGAAFLVGYDSGSRAQVIIRWDFESPAVVVAGAPVGSTEEGIGALGAPLEPSSTTRLALDAAGNLFFTQGDTVHRIDRKTHELTTVLGARGRSGSGGDGGPGADAAVYTPSGLAFRADGTLLVADAGGDRPLRAVWNVGAATPTAGVAVSRVSGDMQTAVVADALEDPLVVAVTGPGDAALDFVSVRYEGSEGVAVSPASVLTDPRGQTSALAHAHLVPEAGTVTARADDLWGDPLPGSPVTFTFDATAPAAGTIFSAVNVEASADRPPALPAASTTAPVLPMALAVASDGTVYIAAFYTLAVAYEVVALSPRGEVRRIAGDYPVSDGAGDGGPALDAGVTPIDLALDEPGARLFIRTETRCSTSRVPSIAGSSRVRVVDLDTGIISTYAGATTSLLGDPFGDGGSAFAADLSDCQNGYLPASSQSQMAFDEAAGDLYLAFRTDRVRVVDDRGRISTAAAFMSPSSSSGFPIALDDGDLLALGTFTDGGGTRYTGSVARWDGTDWAHVVGGGADTGEGVPGADARLSPSAGGFVVDDDGRVVVAELYRVRRLDADGRVRTIAGTGTNRFSGDYGPATDADLETVYDIAPLPGGHLAVATGRRLRIVW